MKRIYFLFLSLCLLTFNGCYEHDFNERSVNQQSLRILVDASHDGGVWWAPQAGIYDPTLQHQGKKLADLLRQYGFTVDELPSYTLITDSILRNYDKVIRAGKYGSYQPGEIVAYRNLLQRGASMFLISEFLGSGETDELAESIGIKFKGTHVGNVNLFGNSTITAGATPFFFNAGSIVDNVSTNPNIQVLGWLSNNNQLPVMGTLNHPSSKILFLGEINGIETTPQPLTDNIIKWLFF